MYPGGGYVSHGQGVEHRLHHRLHQPRPWNPALEEGFESDIDGAIRIAVTLLPAEVWEAIDYPRLMWNTTFYAIMTEIGRGTTVTMTKWWGVR